MGVAALGPYGFNVDGVEPPVTGGGATNTYCIESEGGGETWYMDETRGSPSNIAC